MNKSDYKHQISAFQSHLYGIESAVDNVGKIVSAGFNRTFMELKDAKLRSITCKMNTFQSHLYGIESLKSYILILGKIVSILYQSNYTNQTRACQFLKLVLLYNLTEFYLPYT